jgi:PadR family transcriptional regulator PadR
MGGRAPRLTHSLEAVLDAVMAAPADDPAYGLRICEETSLGPGTVYPVLERLVGYGWVETWQEPEQPSGRPRRRFYRVTGVGRTEFQQARDARATRRLRWTGAPGRLGRLSVSALVARHK